MQRSLERRAAGYALYADQPFTDKTEVPTLDVTEGRTATKSRRRQEVTHDSDAVVTRINTNVVGLVER